MPDSTQIARRIISSILLSVATLIEFMPDDERLKQILRLISDVKAAPQPIKETDVCN
jgi:hypothetical protein